MESNELASYLVSPTASLPNEMLRRFKNKKHKKHKRIHSIPVWLYPGIRPVIAPPPPPPAPAPAPAPPPPPAAGPGPASAPAPGP